MCVCVGSKFEHGVNRVAGRGRNPEQRVADTERMNPIRDVVRVQESKHHARTNIANGTRSLDKMPRMKCAALMFVVWVVSGCTRENPAHCDVDADCTDESRPFCDVDGEYPESRFTAHACSPAPASCPIERCGCTPGASLACAGDQVTLCASDGRSSMTETCPLGCSSSSARCATFAPSNDLQAALVDAALQPDVVLPPGTHVDTTLGLVQDGNGATIAVPSVLVSQNGGASMIRVFKARSFVMDDVKVTGQHALALVAPKSIVVRGLVDASAKKIVGGPGSQESPAVCAGGDTQTQPSGCTGTNCYALGAGGGGNAVAGGAGGGFNGPGAPAGVQVPTFVPLVGGCRGGRWLASDGATLVTTGGAGGGAIQIVSSTAIQLTTVGAISVGGGGGGGVTGGGSGGTVILEAPTVEFAGAGTGIFANGGAGGGCNASGADAQLSIFRAAGPKCAPNSAGDGGTASYPVTSGEICSGTCGVTYAGGGGGSVGRVRIATKTGTYQVAQGATVSAVITALALVAE
jgi:hypothetical protein